MRKTLKLVGMGLILYVAASSPRGAQIVSREIGKMTTQQLYRLRQKLKKMERAGLIILGGEKIKLTKNGQELLKRVQYEELVIKMKKWNGVWHLVSYDIPDSHRKARDAFRFQLKKWDFYQVQESVWVTPYECKEEVAVIAHEYGIAPYVLYMNATDLPMAKRLMNRFHI